jgi:hypothetical protein
MTGRISRHVRSNLVGYVALFVALSGTAYAAATVNSGDVINDSLRSTDLKNGKAVKSVDVKDDGLVGADIDEASLEGVDAANLNGLPRTEFSFRSFIASPANRLESLVFDSYTMITPEAGTEYVIGQIKLKTTANPQEFQICGASGLSDPINYVLYLEGVRTEDSVPGDSCDSAVTFGDRCDFEIAGAGARIWGAPTFIANANTCNVIALKST